MDSQIPKSDAMITKERRNDMAWVAVNKNGNELVFKEKPDRIEKHDIAVWCPSDWWCFIELTSGTIEKLIGRPLTWEDEPVEI